MPATIRIESSPTGAGLRITAAPNASRVGSYGATPFTFTGLEIGAYTFQVQGAYPLPTISYNKTLIDGDNGTLLFHLDASPAYVEEIPPGSNAENGTLNIDSLPSGADVYIGAASVPVGVTPLTITLGPGTYNLRLMLAGFETATGTAIIVSNQVTEAFIELFAIASVEPVVKFGNDAIFTSTNTIANYMRTNWLELLEPGEARSITAYIVATGETIARAGIYEYISPTLPGRLLARTEELVIPGGFSGWKTFRIPGYLPELASGRYHVSINGYNGGAITIARGSWGTPETAGALSFWSIPPVPDPFGHADDYLGAPHDEAISGQGAPMSIYVNYVSKGGAPPVPSRTDTIYWTPDEMAYYRTLSATPSHAPVQAALVTWADARLNNLPVAPSSSTWRDWMNLADLSRRYVDTMAYLYWHTSDIKYANAGINWIFGLFNLGDWTLSGNWQVGCQMGLAVGFGYDAFHDEMTAEELQTVRNQLITRIGGIKNRYSYWEDRYPNHMATLAGAMGVCGLAMMNDYTGAQDWIDYALQNATKMLSIIGEDGGYYEGVGYALYGFENVLPFMDALQRKTGRDLAAEYPRLEGLGNYFIYMTYNNRRLSMEDVTGTASWYYGDMPGFTFMYWLAQRYANGYYQSYAESMARKDTIQGLIWNTPTLAMQPISALPLVKHFRGLGYVIYRSGWGPPEGPDNNTIIIFKSGSSQGHAHNNQNGWSLWTKGASVLSPGQPISDGPGYVTSYGEWDQTTCHNCMLGDGLGQAHEPGDLGTALLGTRGVIETVEIGLHYTYARGDATATYTNNGNPNIYLKTGDLTKWVRHIVIMGPYFVLFDEVAAPKPEMLDWLFQGNGGTFSVNGDVITLNHGVPIHAVMVEPAPFVTQLISDTAITKWPHMRVHPPELVAAQNFLAVMFPDMTALPVTEIKQGNLHGVMVKPDADHLHLVMFSADGAPVNEWITLDKAYVSDDGRTYSISGPQMNVAFNRYLVAKLVTVEAAPEPSTISIKSNPSGAGLSVDGIIIGPTPQTVTLQPGQHTFVLTLTGYFVASQTITTISGDNGEIIFDLVPEPPPSDKAILSITSEPTGAAVTVNGTLDGVTPQNLILAPGEYNLKVEKAGYYMATNIVILLAGDSKTLNIVLNPKPAASISLTVPLVITGSLITIIAALRRRK